jgi:glycosyltransferase involved in cell wall biosynthesis
VFVLPSQTENFGLAVLEALAAGVPVVISRDVGIHQEITAAQAGLVVERSEAALTRALTQLLEDEQLCAAMATRARQLAESHFSCKAMTEQLLGLYRSLCA